MTTYTLDQLDGFPWIVSTDTLKTEHLLVKYWEAAETVAVLLERPCFLDPETLQELRLLVGEDSKEKDWDCDLAQRTLETLTTALEEAAPAGFYFGSQEGDGACFGFWLEQEWADLLEHCGWSTDSDPAALADVVRSLTAGGIDVDNFEDYYQGEAEGYNAAEAGADYAAQLAEDLGSIQTTAQWPHTCIDWELAWRELELGDGYWLERINGCQWAVFRNV